MWGPGRLEARINLWLLLGKWRRGLCLCRHSASRNGIGKKHKPSWGGIQGRWGVPKMSSPLVPLQQRTRGTPWVGGSVLQISQIWAEKGQTHAGASSRPGVGHASGRPGAGRTTRVCARHRAAPYPHRGVPLEHRVGLRGSHGHARHTQGARLSFAPSEHRPSDVSPPRAHAAVTAAHARECGPTAPQHTRVLRAQPAPTCLRRASGNGSGRATPPDGPHEWARSAPPLLGHLARRGGRGPLDARPAHPRPQPTNEGGARSPRGRRPLFVEGAGANGSAAGGRVGQ